MKVKFLPWHVFIAGVLCTFLWIFLVLPALGEAGPHPGRTWFLIGSPVWLAAMVCFYCVGRKPQVLRVFGGTGLVVLGLIFAVAFRIVF